MRIGYSYNFGGLRLRDDGDLLMTGDAFSSGMLPFGVGHKGVTLTGPRVSTYDTLDVTKVELKVKYDVCW